MPLQWRNQFWQSLGEGAGKRCSVCEGALVISSHLSTEIISIRVTLSAHSVNSAEGLSTKTVEAA